MVITSSTIVAAAGVVTAIIFFISFAIAIICTNGLDYLINIFKRFYKTDLKKYK